MEEDEDEQGGGEVGGHWELWLGTADWELWGEEVGKVPTPVIGVFLLVVYSMKREHHFLQLL